MIGMLCALTLHLAGVASHSVPHAPRRRVPHADGLVVARAEHRRLVARPCHVQHPLQHTLRCTVR